MPCRVLSPAVSPFFQPFELIEISCIEMKVLGPLSGMLSVSSCVYM